MPLFDDIVKSSTLGRKGSKNSKSILGNLGVKIMEASEGDTGWEVFCLEFRFPELLEYIFSPDQNIKLMRLWHHLFMIKRNLGKMSQVWLS